VKQWTASPDYGRINVTVSEEGITAHIADDDRQRNYVTRCDLADYQTQIPTDGWDSLRKIIADDFPSAQRTEIEAYITELRHFYRLAPRISKDNQ
jgi:hypothetical protein